MLITGEVEGERWEGWWMKDRDRVVWVGSNG